MLDYNDNIRKLDNLNLDIQYSVANLTFASILKTNLVVIAQLLVGSFLFGLTTFLSVGVNGYHLGSYTATAILNRSFDKFLVLTIPHAIFEIPAIITAGAAGFKIPCEIIRYLLGKKERILTKEDIKEYLTLALISIILIVIAAWVEANVTLRIAKTMLKTKGI